ncbi:MAG: hypothetical protein DMG42_09265 [Acidobacteria bacterium]|nr:MAG: hypothetical protein DMG42_09265 [Acidobacteriota bacterium]
MSVPKRFKRLENGSGSYGTKRDHVSSTQILQEKYAVVFGAGGSIGAAVAKEFAAQGAELFLSGHTKPGVESVTKQIAANGGRAHATVIDTLDDAAVNQYIDDIAKQVCRGFAD